MNSAGLAFDAAAIERAPLNDHPELPTPDPMNFCEIVLRRCATIGEAVDLIRSYNLSYIGSAQFQFTDRTGASVVVAPGADREIAFVYPEGPFQVTTNTNTAIYPAAHRRCSRHRRITKALEKIEAETSVLSVETFASILDSVASPSGPSETMYSNVFDLTNGIAYLYHRHDFTQAAALSINELEAAGEAVAYRIADLVSDSE
jgi:penicillin V acylase-like amidase (Ntn superfamily)